MKSVIDLFRELREDHDYSQSDVAAVLGISQRTIQNMRLANMNFLCGILSRWQSIMASQPII